MSTCYATQIIFWSLYICQTLSLYSLAWVVDQVVEKLITVCLRMKEEFNR